MDANPEVTSPAKGSWSLVQPLSSEHKQDGGVGGRGGERGVGRGGDSQLVHSALTLEGKMVKERIDTESGKRSHSLLILTNKQTLAPHLVDSAKPFQPKKWMECL